MEAGWRGNQAGSEAETIFLMLLHEEQSQLPERKRHAKIKYLQQHMLEILLHHASFYVVAQRFQQLFYNITCSL